MLAARVIFSFIPLPVSRIVIPNAGMYIPYLRLNAVSDLLVAANTRGQFRTLKATRRE